MFYYIEPEVSGGLGNDTVINTLVHPPIVSILHYEFSGWLGNDILETFPCFIVTDRLKDALTFNSCTGVIFDKVKVSTNDTFQDVYQDTELPVFSWLRVTGIAGKDDFGMAQDYRLVISEKVLYILKSFNISEADIEEFVENR